MRNSEDELLSLVTAIHMAGSDPDEQAWPDALHRLSDALGGGGAILVDHSLPDHIADLYHLVRILDETVGQLADMNQPRILETDVHERTEIGNAIRKIVDKETHGWGLDVQAIKIQDIELPDDLKRIMSRQAAAEREKRANIIKSEGDKEAAKNLADAARMMEKAKGAMQLRTLQTLDGLGPTASNTVVLALPVDVLEWFKKGR